MLAINGCLASLHLNESMLSRKDANLCVALVD